MLLSAEVHYSSSTTALLFVESVLFVRQSGFWLHDSSCFFRCIDFAFAFHYGKLNTRACAKHEKINFRDRLGRL